MRTTRLSLCLLAGGLTLLLTGCIWLRLLAFKNQLVEFDRYVKVDDRHGLAFQFVKPVIRAGDVRELLEADPTSKATNGSEQTWFWTFEKLLPDTHQESGNFEMTFTTSFATNKLSQFAIPERFLTILPKSWVLGLFRSFGKARVDQKQRAANVTWVPEGETPIMTRREIIQLLGAPLSTTESNLVSSCLYKYRLKSPSFKPGETMQARAEFKFASDTGKLIRIAASYSTLHINISLEAPKAAGR
jgi:hypothetical protein